MVGLVSADAQRHQMILFVVPRPAGQVQSAHLLAFQPAVYDDDGRIVRVQPATHTVSAALSCVTW